MQNTRKMYPTTTTVGPSLSGVESSSDGSVPEVGVDMMEAAAVVLALQNDVPVSGCRAGMAEEVSMFHSLRPSASVVLESTKMRRGR